MHCRGGLARSAFFVTENNYMCHSNPYRPKEKHLRDYASLAI